jgi:hypothetical protein
MRHQPAREAHDVYRTALTWLTRKARGWPGGLIALAGGVGSATLLYFAVRSPEATTATDLAVAGTQSAVDAILATASAETLAALKSGALTYLFLILVYLPAVVCGILWGRPALRSRAMRTASNVALAAICLGAFLDVTKSVAVWQILNGGRGAWPLVATSTAWPRWFLVMPSALFALVVVLARVNALIQDRTRGLQSAAIEEPLEGDEHAGAHARGKNPSIIPQSLPVDGPEALLASSPGDGELAPPLRDEWAPDAEERRIGICCSGGGIRSAAYNLGALQALHVEGVFQKAKYLTAVSGGAYIAAAHAIVRRDSPEGIRFDKSAFEFSLRSPEERYLRAHTMYLADSLSNKIRFGVRLLMGTFVNLLFFYLLMLVVSRPIGWFLTTKYMHPELADRSIAVQSHFWFVTLWPAIVGLGIALFALLHRFSSDRRYSQTIWAASGLVALSAWMLLVIIVLPWTAVELPLLFTRFLRWLPGVHVQQSDTRNYMWLLQVLGGAALVGAVVRALMREKARIALFVAGLLVPLGAAVAFVLLVGDAAALGPEGQVSIFGNDLGSQFTWFLVISGALLLFAGLSDETLWSMHPFYKRRLASAYALRRTSSEEAEAVKYDEVLLLTHYEKPAGEKEPWPELIVCAAANISDIGAVPTGRRSVSFTFGPKEIGGPHVGYIETAKMEAALDWRRQRDITLQAAVAISGAALSPAMGKMTRPGVTALLALANARLGVWLPNPRWVTAMRGRAPNARWSQRPRVRYLFNEMLGKHPRDGLFLYVTDGGHWENLGLVEALRRGCTEVYCFDAAGDKPDTFFTLGEAVALARTELGVEIEIDPEKMEPRKPLAVQGGHLHNARVTKDGHARKDGTSEDQADEQLEPLRSDTNHVIAPFTYPNGVKGRLIYCKAALTHGDPWDVKAYAEKEHDFPAHGTVHQLYREERFEAYRMLGFHTARDAVRTIKGKGPRPKKDAPMFGPKIHLSEKRSRRASRPTKRW